MRLALLLSFCLLAGPAGAAPVVTGAKITISGFAPGIAPITIGGGFFGTVSVTGSTVIVPAGLVSLPAGTTIVVPVTGASAINSLWISRLSNLQGTFRPGGATTQLPSEVCPAGPGFGEACVAGGGVGGKMILTGTVLIPNLGFHGLPINLNQARVGQGGSTNFIGDVDAAAWTTGTGSIGLATSTSTQRGGRSPFRLVSPTYLEGFGLFEPFVTTLTLTAVSLPVPEPGALALLLTGAAGLLWLRRG